MAVTDELELGQSFDPWNGQTQICQPNQVTECSEPQI